MSENGVHEEFKVVACCGVAVEVYASCFFEGAVHFHESDGHIYEVVFGRSAPNTAYGIQILIQFRMLVIDLVMPFIFDAIGGPYIAEVGPFGGGAYGGVEVSSLVEGGVQVYEVY